MGVKGLGFLGVLGLGLRVSGFNFLTYYLLGQYTSFFFPEARAEKAFLQAFKVWDLGPRFWGF